MIPRMRDFEMTQKLLATQSQRKKEEKYERLVDFTFDLSCVGFCSGVALASLGRFHVNEAGLSGRGQEEKT